MSENSPPIGTAEELQISLDETIERLRGITLELTYLEVAAREVLNAWQGQGNLNLAMARLARLIAKEGIKA